MKRIAVIGAGIVGSSVGFHLSEQGANVTIFDKSGPGSGATDHSFAWINAFSKRPRKYFDLNHRSVDMWARFGEKIGLDLGLKWGGNVTYCSDIATGDQLKVECETMQTWGYPVRSITRDELSCLEPNLKIGDFTYGVYMQNEGHVVAALAARTSVESMVRNGGGTYLEQKVHSIIQIKDKVIVEIDHDKMEFDHVVVSAGIGSTDLWNTLGVHLPQRRSPGVVVRTNPIPKIMDILSTIYLPPTVKNGKELHVRQDDEGIVTIGSGNQENETEDDSQIHAAETLRNASQFFPDLKDLEAIAVPVGFRPMPVDGMPVVGFSEKADRVYSVIMHSGVTLAPLVGLWASTEIMSGIEIDSLSPYRPSRFSN
jgi:glycine/D-amino acid oxidase-like deaminating enzyme